MKQVCRASRAFAGSKQCKTGFITNIKRMLLRTQASHASDKQSELRL